MRTTIVFLMSFLFFTFPQISAQDCFTDTHCYSSSDIEENSNAVVRLRMLKDDGTHIGYCTGTLINNSASPGLPLILTARHCLCDFGSLVSTIRKEPSGENVLKLELDFNYKKDSNDCQNSAYSISGNTKYITDAIVIQVNESTDQALIMLNENPLKNPSITTKLLGWNFNSPDNSGFVFHHPHGLPQKISTIEDIEIGQNFSSWIGCSVFYNSLNFNEVQVKANEFLSNGSSGSSVLNDNFQINGVISGVVPILVNLCDYNGNTTYEKLNYGKISQGFSSIHSDPFHGLRFWLAPNNNSISELNSENNPDAGIFLHMSSSDKIGGITDGTTLGSGDNIYFRVSSHIPQNNPIYQNSEFRICVEIDGQNCIPINIEQNNNQAQYLSDGSINGFYWTIPSCLDGEKFEGDNIIFKISYLEDGNITYEVPFAIKINNNSTELCCPSDSNNEQTATCIETNYIYTEQQPVACCDDLIRDCDIENLSCGEKYIVPLRFSTVGGFIPGLCNPENDLRPAIDYANQLFAQANIKFVWKGENDPIPQITGVEANDGSNYHIIKDCTVSDPFGDSDSQEDRDLSIFQQDGEYIEIYLVNTLSYCYEGTTGINLTTAALCSYPNHVQLSPGYIILPKDSYCNNSQNSADFTHHLAHELGHYLGLYHTFETEIKSCDESSPCYGDGICDTPLDLVAGVTPGSNCGSFNLMDYPSTGCGPDNSTFELSKCQSAKVQDILFTCRNNLCGVQMREDYLVQDNRVIHTCQNEEVYWETLDDCYSWYRYENGERTTRIIFSGNKYYPETSTTGTFQFFIQDNRKSYNPDCGLVVTLEVDGYDDPDCPDLCEIIITPTGCDENQGCNTYTIDSHSSIVDHQFVVQGIGPDLEIEVGEPFCIPDGTTSFTVVDTEFDGACEESYMVMESDCEAGCDLVSISITSVNCETATVSGELLVSGDGMYCVKTSANGVCTMVSGGAFTLLFDTNVSSIQLFAEDGDDCMIQSGVEDVNCDTDCIEVNNVSASLTFAVTCVGEPIYLHGMVEPSNVPMYWETPDGEGNIINSYSLEAIYYPSLLDAGTTVDFYFHAGSGECAEVSDRTPVFIHTIEHPSCSDACSASVNVNFTTDDEICVGDEICFGYNFQGTADYAQVIVDNDPFTTDLTIKSGNVCFTPENTGEVIVRVIPHNDGANGCMGTAISRSFIVLDDCSDCIETPTLTIQENTIQYCPDDCTTVSGSYAGDHITGVIASFNGEMLSMTGGTGQFNFLLCPDASGIHSVTVSTIDEICGSISETAEYNFNAPSQYCEECDVDPIIVDHTDLDVCHSETIVFELSSSTGVSWSTSSLGAFTESGNTWTFTPTGIGTETLRLIVADPDGNGACEGYELLYDVSIEDCSGDNCEDDPPSISAENNVFICGNNTVTIDGAIFGYGVDHVVIVDANPANVVSITSSSVNTSENSFRIKVRKAASSSSGCTDLTIGTANVNGVETCDQATTTIRVCISNIVDSPSCPCEGNIQGLQAYIPENTIFCEGEEILLGAIDDFGQPYEACWNVQGPEDGEFVPGVLTQGCPNKYNKYLPGPEDIERGEILFLGRLIDCENTGILVQYKLLPESNRYCTDECNLNIVPDLVIPDYICEEKGCVTVSGQYKDPNTTINVHSGNVLYDWTLTNLVYPNFEIEICPKAPLLSMAPINRDFVFTVEDDFDVCEREFVHFTIPILETCAPCPEPYILECIDDITVSTDVGRSFATVDITFTLDDPCVEEEKLTSALSYVPSVGFDRFYVGTTTGTYGYKDTDCSFTVTVIDSEPPAVNNCPVDQNVSLNEDCEYIIPDLTIDLDITDNVGVVSIEQTPSIGTIYSGHGIDVAIKITVTDATGNSTSCEYTVTTIDDIFPEIQAPPLADIFCDDDPTDLQLTGFPTILSENCGDYTITYEDINNIACEGLGLFTRRWTVTDVAGNTDVAIQAIRFNGDNFSCGAEDDPIPVYICEGVEIEICLPDGYDRYGWGGTLSPQCQIVDQAGIYFGSVQNTVTGCYQYFRYEVIDVDEGVDPIELSACADETSIDLIAPPNYAYVWSNGSTDESISVSASGTYSVDVTVTTGCTYTQMYEVTLLQSPEENTETDRVICADDLPYTLSAPSGYTYTWSTFQNTESISIYSSGEYTVDLINSDGCMQSISYQITVLESLAEQENEVITYCSADFPTELMAPEGYSYVWSDGSTQRQYAITNAGTYTVTITNGANCSQVIEYMVTSSPTPNEVNQTIEINCFQPNESVTLEAPTGYSYYWFDGATTAQKNVIGQGVYFLTITNNAGCTQEIEYEVLSTSGVLEEQPEPIDICNDAFPMTLSAPGGYSYNWYNNSTNQSIEVNSSGTYDVLITNIDGCSQILSYSVSTTDAPNEDTPQGVTICRDELPYSLSAPSGYMYQWQNGASTQTYAAQYSGNYRVTITTASGCEQRLIYPVSVKGLPDEEVSQEIDLCTDQFPYEITAPDGYDYAWFDASTDQLIEINAEGTYSLILSTEHGCEQEVQYEVKSNASITDASLQEDFVICKGNNTSLVIDIQGGAAPYTVVFSDGTNQYTESDYTSGEEISISPIEEISFNLISIEDSNGCYFQANDIQTIYVSDCEITNTYLPSDPCSCNDDQSANGALDGTFSETISVSGTTSTESWTVTEVQSPSGGLLPSGITVGEELNYDATNNRHEYTFSHTDRSGFLVSVEGPNALGHPSNVTLQISNVCQYPVLSNNVLLDEYNLCEVGSFDLSNLNGEVNGYAGTMSIKVNGVLSPNGIIEQLEEGEYTIVWEFEGDFVSNQDGTVNSPAFAGCSTSVVESFDVIYNSLSVTCNDLVHISVQDDCLPHLTPAMLLEAEDPTHYTLTLSNGEVGEAISDSEVFTGIDWTDIPFDSPIGYTITSACGISCWGEFILEDKLAPVITCPSDIVLPCFTNYEVPTTEELIALFVTDNCSVASVTITKNDLKKQSCSEQIEDDITAIQTICFQAEDASGNTSEACCYTVQYEATGVEEVVFPETVVLSCSNYTTWESEVNIGMGVPSIDNNGESYPIFPSEVSHCNIQATYSDQVIQTYGGAYKVIRTWLVAEWCSSEIRTHEQILKVESDQLVLDIAQTNYETSTETYTCKASFLLPMEDIRIMGLCDDSTIDFTVEIYKDCLTSEGSTQTVVGSFNTVPLVEDLELGCYTLVYHAVSSCGERAEMSIEVEVHDITPPTIVCEAYTVVSLSEDGSATAHAISFDDHSFDTCSDIRFGVRRTDACEADYIFDEVGSFGGKTYFDEVAFCCEDIGTPIEVELIGVDNSGNINSCIVFVEVQDKSVPEFVCPSNTVYEHKCDLDVIPDLGSPSVVMGSSYCSTDFEITLDDIDTSNADGCGNYTLTKRWNIRSKTTNNVVHTCSQDIVMKNISLFDPSTINWPQAEIESETCEIASVHPSIIGEPSYPQSACSLVSHTFEDQVFPDVDPYCNKILRTWTVLDWCQFDQNNPLDGGMWTFVQTIKLHGDDEEQTIFGRIATEENIPLEETMIVLSGETTRDTLFTDEEGGYSFPNMSMQNDYVLHAENDNDHIKGVSTLDLVLIQRHILGLRTLDSPYKIIAADINNSESISAVDLVQLRKLILGIYDAFPNNTSWRFVDESYVFIDSLYPWGFDESCLVQKDSTHDFVAVKVGDVNGSITSSFGKGHISKRSTETFTLSMKNAQLRKGQTIKVPVYGSESSLIGLQGTITFDASQMQLRGIEAGILEINDTHLGLQHLEDGLVTISWNTSTSLNIQEDEPLFYLFIEANVVTDLSSIDWISEITPSEAYNEDLSPREVLLQKRSTQDLPFSVEQNIPNPFLEETRIRFTLPQQDRVTLTLLDLEGKVIIQKEVQGHQGINTVSLSKHEINTSGIILYQIRSEYGTDIKKMIVL